MAESYRGTKHLRCLPIRRSRFVISLLEFSRVKATGVIEPRADVFTKDELIAFEQQAETLNKTDQGDQACFYLQKA